MEVISVADSTSQKRELIKSLTTDDLPSIKSPVLEHTSQYSAIATNLPASPDVHSILGSMAIRQEEHLQALTSLHKDMLQKVESEWRSLVSHQPYQARARNKCGSLDLHNTGSIDDTVSRTTTANDADGPDASNSLVLGPQPTPDNANKKVLGARTSRKYPDLRSEDSADLLDVRNTGRKSQSAFEVGRSLSSEIKSMMKMGTFDRLNGIVRDKRIVVEVKNSKRDLNSKKSNALKDFIRSSRFDQISALLVISNSLFIGVQVELMFNTTEESDTVRYIDASFCTLFVLELWIRLYTYGRREYFFGRDLQWNWFDFTIVSFSTLDTSVSFILGGNSSVIGSISVLRTVRILRVTRALRIIRVLKFFKDLRIMIAAIISTLKTAAWAFLLLLIAMYVFGIAIAQCVGDYKQQMEKSGTPLPSTDPNLEWFGSLPQAVFTLFMAITGGIDYEIASTPLKTLPIALVIFVFFLMFSSFCVMNVLTGIFCQNAIETFENDKENMIECQLAEKERFVATLTTMFKEWDTAGDGQCTREEFEKHVSDQEVQILLRTLDIDARDALQLFSMLDVSGTGCVDLEDFVHGCITLRGKAKAVHMERALIDSKLANSKLDAIIKSIREVRSQTEDSFFLGRVRETPTATATTNSKKTSFKAAATFENLAETVEAVNTSSEWSPNRNRACTTTSEEMHLSEVQTQTPMYTQMQRQDVAQPPCTVTPKPPEKGSSLLFGVVPDG